MRGIAMMVARLSSLAMIAGLAVLPFAAPLRAQTISGIIAGRVLDPQQKPAPSVAIIAHNPATGRDFPNSTDEQGYYRILEVPPGNYEVSAFLAGFKKEVHTSVRVDVGRTTEEDFTLSIEPTVSAVTVHATESEAPMAVRDSPTLSTSFPEKQIIEIPIITRDVNNLALLAPGVLSVRTFSFASTLVPFSVNGSRGRDNNFIIDSVDNNEPLFGGAATQFTNNEIFNEYTILTAQEKAEFGRNTGATINAITKSGSNNWHGSAFAYGQSDMWNALNNVEKQALLTSPEPFYETVLGGTLGGPIKKEKAFFFVSYQWDRLSDNLTDVLPVLGNYPTTISDLNLIKGLPTTPTLQTYLAVPSVQKVTGIKGTPCFKRTPLNNPSNLYQAQNPCLVTSTPVGLSGGLPATQFANFNVWNVPNANSFNLRDHEVSGRYDQRINNSNDFYSRYLFDDLASPQFPLNSPGVGAFGDLGLMPDYQSLLRQRTQSVLADHRYQRVNSLNEFRLSYSRVSQSQGAYNVSPVLRDNSSAVVADFFANPGAPPTQPAGTLGPLGGQGSISGNGLRAGLFPSAGSDLTLGQDSSPTNITSNTYQIQDNYSLTHGRHNMKFGANFIKIDTNVASMPDNLGFYLYAGGWTGNGFQDFATVPSTFTKFGFNGASAPLDSTASAISQRLTDIRTNAQGMITGFGPNEVKIKEFDQFYFAQDDWRVKDNLTFSFGLRYENFGQPINSIHDINKLAPLVNTDNMDFAPRLGFAWSPGKSWVVRGGYGIAYNPPILNIPLLLWQSGPVSPLLSTDNFGLAQLQPTGVFPKVPFNLADFQQSYPNIFAFGPGGVASTTTVNSGMVQGCSLYLDLYDLFQVGNGVTPTTVFPSRAYNSDAGITFAPNGTYVSGVTAPPNIPIQNCSNQDTVAKNLKNPYQQTWSLGVQKELGANYLFEVNYVGSKGSRLFQRVDKNPFQGWYSTCLTGIESLYTSAGLGNIAATGQCRFPRIDDTHGDITEVTNGGSSSYNALQTSFTKRWSRTKYFGDYAFTIAYTWSHLIDNTSEIFGPGFRTLQPGDLQPPCFTVAGAPYPAGCTTGGFKAGAIPIGLLFDPLANAPVESITPLAQTFDCTASATTNCRGERGNSSFDRRNRFVSSFLWEPFPTKNAWLRDWQLNGVYTYQSGQPFTPLNAEPFSACGDTNGDGSLSNDRPDIGSMKAPKNTVALLADPSCLSTAAGYNIYRIKNGVASSPINGATPVPLAMAMTMARFVQRPLYASATITPFTPNGIPPNLAGGVTYAGTAGRNILVGPAINNIDLSLIRNIKLTERFKLQFRTEVYDLFNHPNAGFFNGNPYISNATGATAFAYNATRTGAAITGGIPENAIDSVDNVTGNRNFLSKSAMNTSTRRIQFGLRLMF